VIRAREHSRTPPNEVCVLIEGPAE